MSDVSFPEQPTPRPGSPTDESADERASHGGPASLQDGLTRVPLLGLDMVSADSLDPVVDLVLGGARVHTDKIAPVLLTPNVDIMVHLDDDRDSVEAGLFRRAQYCLPDGQPLVLVSGLFGQSLGARLPGSGLFAELWPRMVTQQVPTVVVASSQEIAARLEVEHPKSGFIVPPMFDADDAGAIDEIVSELLEQARSVDPEIVLVGIGNPKDARIIDALLQRWDDQAGDLPLCVGLGGSFAMYLGLKKRAPEWVQRLGMEWFYRFAQEPRRLFHRYFVRDMAFIPMVVRELISTRRRKR